MDSRNSNGSGNGANPVAQFVLQGASMELPVSYGGYGNIGSGKAASGVVISKGEVDFNIQANEVFRNKNISIDKKKELLEKILSSSTRALAQKQMEQQKQQMARVAMVSGSKQSGRRVTRSKSAGPERALVSDQKQQGSPQGQQKVDPSAMYNTNAPDLSSSFLHSRSPSPSHKRDSGITYPVFTDFPKQPNDFTLPIQKEEGVPSRQIRKQMDKIVQNLNIAHNLYKEGAKNAANDQEFVNNRNVLSSSLSSDMPGDQNGGFPDDYINSNILDISDNVMNSSQVGSQQMRFNAPKYEMYMSEREKYALKVGSMILNGSLSSARGGADTSVKYSYELDHLAKAEAVSRFFFDAWLARNGGVSHEGGDSAVYQAKMMEILAEMQKSINRIQHDEFNRSIEVSEVDNTNNTENGGSNSNNYIQYLAAVGLNALDRLIRECGNSAHVLNEIKSSIMPSIYPDFDKIEDYPINLNTTKGEFNITSKYLSTPTWAASCKEAKSAQAPLLHEAASLRQSVELLTAEVANRTKTMGELVQSVEQLTKDLAHRDRDLSKANKTKKELVEEVAEIKKQSKENEARLNREIAQSAELIKKQENQVQKLQLEKLETDKEVAILRARDFPDLKDKYKQICVELEKVKDEKGDIIKELNSYRILANDCMTEKSKTQSEIKELLNYAKLKLTDWYKCCSISKDLFIKHLISNDSFDSSKGFGLVSSWFKGLCDDINEYEIALCETAGLLESKVVELSELGTAYNKKLEEIKHVHQDEIIMANKAHKKEIEDLHQSFELKIEAIEATHNVALKELNIAHEVVIREQKHAISGLEYMIKDLTDKLRQVKTIESNLRGDVSRLEKEAVAHKAFVAELQDEFKSKSNAMQENNDKLSFELTAKERDLANLANTLNLRLEDISRLEAVVGQLEATAKISENTINGLQENVNALTIALQRADSSIKSLEADKEMLNRSFLDSEMRLVKREEEFREQIVGFVSTIELKSEQITQLQAEIEGLLIDQTNLRATLERKELECLDQNRAIQEKASEIEERDQLVAKMKNEFNELSTEFSRNNSDSTQLFANNSRLQAKLNKITMWYEYSVILREDKLASLNRELEHKIIEKIKLIEESEERKNRMNVETDSKSLDIEASSIAMVYSLLPVENLNDDNQNVMEGNNESAVEFAEDIEDSVAVNVGNDSNVAKALNEQNNSAYNPGDSELIQENNKLKEENIKLTLLIKKLEAQMQSEISYVVLLPSTILTNNNPTMFALGSSIDDDKNDNDDKFNMQSGRESPDMDDLNTNSVAETIHSQETNALKTIATCDSFDTARQLRFEKQYMNMIVNNSDALKIDPAVVLDGETVDAGGGISNSPAHFADLDDAEVDGVSGQIYSEELKTDNLGSKQTSVNRIRGLTQKLRSAVNGGDEEDSITNPHLPRGNPFKLVQPFIGFIQANEKKLARENGKLTVIVREAHEFLRQIIGELSNLQMKEQIMLGSNENGGLQTKEKVWRSIVEIKKTICENMNILFDDQSYIESAQNRPSGIRHANGGLNCDMKVATLLKLTSLYSAHRSQQQKLQDEADRNAAQSKIYGAKFKAKSPGQNRSSRLDSEIIEVLEDIVSNYSTSIKLAGGFRTQLFLRNGEINPYTVENIVAQAEHLAPQGEAIQIMLSQAKVPEIDDLLVRVAPNFEEIAGNDDDGAREKDQNDLESLQSIDDSVTELSIIDKKMSNVCQSPRLNNDFDDKINAGSKAFIAQDDSAGASNAFVAKPESINVQRQLRELSEERDHLKTQLADLQKKLADVQTNYGAHIQGSSLQIASDIGADDNQNNSNDPANLPINEKFAIHFDEWAPLDQVDIFREMVKFLRAKQVLMNAEKKKLEHTNNQLKEMVNLEQIKVSNLNKELYKIRNAKDGTEIEKNFAIYRQVKQDLIRNAYADYNRSISDNPNKTQIYDVIYQEHEIDSISRCVSKVIEVLKDLADLSFKSKYKPRSLIRQDSKNAKPIAVSASEMFESLNRDLDMTALEQKEDMEHKPGNLVMGDIDGSQLGQTSYFEDPDRRASDLVIGSDVAGGLPAGGVENDSFAQTNLNDSITLHSQLAHEFSSTIDRVRPDAYTHSVQILINEEVKNNRNQDLDAHMNSRQNSSDKNFRSASDFNHNYTGDDYDKYDFDELSEGSMNIIENYNITKRLSSRALRSTSAHSKINSISSTRDKEKSHNLGIYNSHKGLNWNKKTNNKYYDMSIQASITGGALNNTNSSSSKLSGGYDLLLNLPLMSPSHTITSNYRGRGNKGPSSLLSSVMQERKKESKLFSLYKNPKLYESLDSASFYTDTGRGYKTGSEISKLKTAASNFNQSEQPSSPRAGNINTNKTQTLPVKVDIASLQSELVSACDKMVQRYMLLDVAKFRHLKDEFDSLRIAQPLGGDINELNYTSTSNDSNNNSLSLLDDGCSSAPCKKNAVAGIDYFVGSKLVDGKSAVFSGSSDVQKYFKMINAKMNDHLKSASSYLEILDEVTLKYTSDM